MDFVQRGGGGSVISGGSETEVSTADAPGVFIDLGSPGGEGLLLLTITDPESDGPIGDEVIRGFLAPFRVDANETAQPEEVPANESADED